MLCQGDPLRGGGNKVQMIVVLMLLGLLGFSASSATAATGAKPSLIATAAPQKPLVEYASLPLSFVPNVGQTDPRVKFLARGKGYTLFLTSDEAVLELEPGTSLSTRNSAVAHTRSVLRMHLSGMVPNPQFSGVEQLPGETNYFQGSDPRQWHAHIPAYREARYGGVYPGIDLAYYGNQGQLEYDFVVKPDGDPAKIHLRIEGSQAITIDDAGGLLLRVSDGYVRFARPQAYQEKSGRRSAVAAGYVRGRNGDIGFTLGRYDRREPLIIDPVLSYSTYLGGTGVDAAYGLAVDSSGNAYIAGTTGSANFPTTLALQTTNAGGGDVFVSKLNPSGTALVYSTYLGGSGADQATSLVLNSSGNVYVAGNTSSSNFPTTSAAFQTTYGGSGDAFVAELSPDGSSLVYSSYLGGSAQDSAQALAVDSSGSAYLTGSTQSSDFPVLNALQVGNDGCTVVNTVLTCSSDAFVAKVDPKGANLVYSTYLGGSSADYGQAIVVDTAGNAYLAGYTYSKDFPVQNAFQTAIGGGIDAFLTALSADGSALIFSTYLGGSGQDRAFGLAMDASGAIFLTGDTQSKDFPTGANAFQSENAGSGDAFVCKFAPRTSQLLYSTFLGGTNVDQGTAITLDPAGDAFVTGLTESSDFPTVDPLQKLLGSSGAGACGTGVCSDAFVAELRPSGQVVYSTYLGGNGADLGQAIAVDSSGVAYVAGSTSSTNFPAVAGAAQGTLAVAGSNSDAFIAKVSGANAAALAITPQQLNFGNQTLNVTSNPLPVMVIDAGSSPLHLTAISPSGDFAQTNNCGDTVPAGGGSCTIQVTFTPTTTGARTDQISITDNAPGSPHQITVTGDGVASSQGSLTFTPTSLNFPTETIGTTSPAQIVHVSNTGKASLIISAIGVSGDYAETNTCGTLPSILNVGDGCTVSITFTPTSSGSRTSTLNFATNAASASSAVALSGIGTAVFSLSASTRSETLLIGTTATSTTPTSNTNFTVTAAAPSTFSGVITLSCSSNASCSFSPSSLSGGQSSTITVTSLTVPSTGPAPPVNITVTGTSGGQTATVVLTIFFSDFTVSATPAFNSVIAGNSGTYTVTITPSNGFNSVVQLGCAQPLPASDMACDWSPGALLLNGAPLTSILTVTTIKQTLTARMIGARRGPGANPGSGPGLRLWVLCVLALLLLLVARIVGRRRLGERVPLYLRLASACLLLCMVAVGNSCTAGNPTPLVGTPSGDYTLALTGTLGTTQNNKSPVVRITTVNLAVGQ